MFLFVLPLNRHIGEGGDELQKDIWLILMEKLRGIHCLIIKTIKKPENK